MVSSECDFEAITFQGLCSFSLLYPEIRFWNHIWNSIEKTKICCWKEKFVNEWKHLLKWFLKNSYNWSKMKVSFLCFKYVGNYLNLNSQKITKYKILKKKIFCVSKKNSAFKITLINSIGICTSLMRFTSWSFIISAYTSAFWFPFNTEHKKIERSITELLGKLAIISELIPLL